MIVGRENLDDFAGSIRSLLVNTVVDIADLDVIERPSATRVLPQATSPGRRAMPLAIGGVHYLDLDFAFGFRRLPSVGHYRLETSGLSLAFASDRQPLVRFDYVRARSWGAGHIQLHAESSTLGYLFALGRRRQPPRTRTQELHLPAGAGTGPSMAEVIELAVHDLGVDASAGWSEHVQRWKQREDTDRLQDLIRQRIREHPVTGGDDMRALVTALEQEA